MTLLSILLFLAAYAVVGCFVRAAYICKRVDKTGYLSYRYESTAEIVGFVWPLVGPFLLIAFIIESLSKLSNFMFELCFRFKTGKKPI